jgi:hypothetical protein
MEAILIILLIIGVGMLILSYFQKDKTKVIETQLENFTIQVMKEIYQVKKKVKIVEEELMINDKKNL